MEKKGEDLEEICTDSQLVEVNTRVRQKDGRNLKADVSYFCLSENMADVWFAFKEDSGKLPAHKLLLSMRSEVFEAMFYGSLAESSQTITVEDIDIHTMKMILRYIYSDNVKLDGKTVTYCLYAAKKYALYDLVDKCTRFLPNAIAVGTACAIYEQAQVFDEYGLQANCHDYIVENSPDVFPSEDFNALSNESLLKILASDHLNSDECLHFAAVKRWAEIKCKTNALEITPENIRKCLGDVLFMIRFPLMPINTFAKEVAPTGILTYEEMLMMYHHLATKTEFPDVQNVGRFSCAKRGIVMKFDKLKQTPAYQGCLLNLNTSNPVHLVSVKGKFVTQVTKIELSSTGRNDIAFDINGDRLDLREPLLLRQPTFSHIQLTFYVKSGKGCEPAWSTDVNVLSSIKDSTVNVRRVPCGLKTLVFKA